MGLNVQQGFFKATTGGTSQGVTVGFQPKAIIFYAVSDNTQRLAGLNTSGFSIGYSDGTNHRVIAVCGNSGGLTTTVVGRDSNSANCISILTNGTPTVNTRASVAFTATGFTLTWSSTPGNTYCIYYLAIAGSDVTSVAAGSGTMPTSTGNLAVTGLGFKPSSVLLLSVSLTTATTASGGQFSLGCALSSTKRWAHASVIDNGVTTNSAAAILQNTACLQGVITGGTSEYFADFVSMDGDGFTLNFSTAPGSAYLFFYLAVAGAQWDAGVSTAPASATTQKVTGMAFAPTGLILTLSELCIAVNTVVTKQSLAFGAAGGNSYGMASFVSIDPTTTEFTSNLSTNIIIDPGVSAQGQASFTSFDSGGWTITWSVDTHAYLVPWVAVGPLPSGSGGMAGDMLAPHRYCSRMWP